MSASTALDRRALLGLAAGTGIGWIASSLRRGPGGPGPVALWVADRASDRVVALDAGLLVCRSLPLERPVALARAGPDAVWALGLDRDRGGAPRGALWRSTAGGLVESHGDLEAVLGLTPVGSDGAAVLGHGGRVLVRLEPGSGIRWDPLDEPARSVWGSPGGDALLLFGDSELARLRPGAAAYETCLADEVEAIAPAPTGWWVLGARRLWRLADDLGVSASRAREQDWAALARHGEDEHVWVFDRAGRSATRVAARCDSDRRLEWRLAGAWRGAPTAHAGLVVLTSGAVLAFDRRGRAVASQGGFRELSALALVEAPDATRSPERRAVRRPAASSRPGSVRPGARPG